MTNIPDLIQLYDLARTLEGDPLVAHVRKLLASRADESPWAVFAVASKERDVDLGRYAIIALARGNGDGLMDGSWNRDEIAVSTFQFSGVLITQSPSHIQRSSDSLASS